MAEPAGKTARTRRPAAETRGRQRAVPKVRPLAEVLAYKNEHVVHKFRERFDLPLAETRELFQETKKWLWLAARSSEHAAAGAPTRPLAIDKSLLLLDEMWHVFILFTREYSAFCQRYFGHYIHHAPTTRQEQIHLRRLAAKDPQRAWRDQAELMRAQYEFVYDQLGEATVRRWYSRYALKHTPEFVRRIRR